MALGASYVDDSGLAESIIVHPNSHSPKATLIYPMDLSCMDSDPDAVTHRLDAGPNLFLGPPTASAESVAKVSYNLYVHTFSCSSCSPCFSPSIPHTNLYSDNSFQSCPPVFSLPHRSHKHTYQEPFHQPDYLPTQKPVKYLFPPKSLCCSNTPRLYPPLPSSPTLRPRQQ